MTRSQQRTLGTSDQGQPQVTTSFLVQVQTQSCWTCYNPTHLPTPTTEWKASLVGLQPARPPPPPWRRNGQLTQPHCWSSGTQEQLPPTAPMGAPGCGSGTACTPVHGPDHLHPRACEFRRAQPIPTWKGTCVQRPPWEQITHTCFAVHTDPCTDVHGCACDVRTRTCFRIVRTCVHVCTYCMHVCSVHVHVCMCTGDCVTTCIHRWMHLHVCRIFTTLVCAVHMCMYVCSACVCCACVHGMCVCARVWLCVCLCGLHMCVHVCVAVHMCLC